MNRYDTDVMAWANEQAAFIRAGHFDLVDIEHIADEIEGVGKSEVREFISSISSFTQMARPRGFEPLTSASGGLRSIQLSYGRIDNMLIFHKTG